MKQRNGSPLVCRERSNITGYARSVPVDIAEHIIARFVRPLQACVRDKLLSECTIGRVICIPYIYLYIYIYIYIYFALDVMIICQYFNSVVFHIFIAPNSAYSSDQI